MSITNLITTGDQRYVPVSKAAKEAMPEHLLQKANLRDITIYAVQDWLVIIATWLVLAVGPIWIYPLGVLIISSRLNAFGTLLHDACHLKRSNSIHTTLIDCLAGYPILLSIEGMRYHHIRHHRYACSELDPYLKPSVRTSIAMRILSYLRGIVVTIAWFIRPYFGLLARVYPQQKNTYAKLFYGDKSKEDLSHAKDIDFCLQRDIGQLIFQTIVIGLTIYFTHWMVLYYIIPLIFGYVVNGIRVVEEHTHEVTKDNSPLNILQFTNDQPTDRISRYLFFPRNVGFHRMHHLHPTARHESLPKLAKWYVEYAKKMGTEEAVTS